MSGSPLRRYRLAGGLSVTLAGDRWRVPFDYWLPRSAQRVAVPPGEDGGLAAPGACIRVCGMTPDVPPGGEPLLRIRTVRALSHGDVVTLHGDDAVGHIDLARRRARLRPDPAGAELYSMLLIASALLLGRMSAALVHAAAVVAHDGGIWLLAGDARAGKTTTVANLMRAGHAWLSDDNVVLRPRLPHGVTASGWPRTFHLDEGWERGTPTGTRVDTDPEAIASGAWQVQGPLAGVLLPVVDSDASTRLRTATAAEAFAGLVRQSPWLLADPPAALTMLPLMQHASTLPAYHLCLGSDVYASPERLREVLGEIDGWNHGSAA